MSSITKKIEKALGVDLNGDGVIGSDPSYGYGSDYQSHRHKDGGLIDKLENVVHMDINGDGRIGNKPKKPAYSTNYNQYDGPAHPPNYNSYGEPGGPAPHSHQSSGGGGLVDKLENVVHMDLNGDGRIGNKPKKPAYSTNYDQYGGPSYAPNNNQYSGPPGPPNYDQYGGPSYPPNNNQFSGPPVPRNYDQYGGPSYSSNNNQFSGPPGPPNYSPYSGPGGPAPHSYQSSGGGGLINKLENVVHMDLNGDGRIGSGPTNSSNFNPYGYRQ